MSTTKLRPYTPTTTGWTATVVNSALFDRIRKLPLGQTYTLSEGETVYPDVVAYKCLDDSNYAWIIMCYNSFLDIRELSYDYGTRIINVPDKQALLNLVTELIAG